MLYLLLDLQESFLLTIVSFFTSIDILAREVSKRMHLNAELAANLTS